MDNKTQDRIYWTVKELAEAANLNESRIRQLLISGELNGEKKSRIWLVRNTEAQRWLKSRQS